MAKAKIAVETRTVSFDTTPSQGKLIRKIADRAMTMAAKYDVYPDNDKQAWQMDLAACHANGCPMDFKKLLAADDFNFMHDVFGITKHLDRQTGFLGDYFLPRARQPEAKRRA